MLMLISTSALVETGYFFATVTKIKWTTITKHLRLTSPSIWICLTGESKVPPVEAIAAVVDDPGSVREDIYSKHTRVKEGLYSVTDVSLYACVSV